MENIFASRQLAIAPAPGTVVPQPTAPTGQTQPEAVRANAATASDYSGFVIPSLIVLLVVLIFLYFFFKHRQK